MLPQAQTGDSPRVKVSQGLEGVRGSDELVQDADDVSKLGPAGALLLPALHHELVDGRRAVHGCGEPEAFVDGFHDLGASIMVALAGSHMEQLYDTPPPRGPNTERSAPETDKQPFLSTYTISKPSMGQVLKGCLQDLLSASSYLYPP